jgi:multiple sugar transport system substrate-binding protein
VLAVTTLLAAGCGGATARVEERILTVYLADDWADTSAVADAVRTFEAANPGVEVRVNGVPFSRLPDAVRDASERGTAVDVAQWHAFAAAALGEAQPVEDLFDATWDRDEFLPGAITDVEWGGTIHGVPLDTAAMVLAVNADLLEAAGTPLAGIVDVEDLGEASRRVSTTAPRGMVLSLSTWTLYGWIRAFGGDVVEVGEDGTPTFLLDSPEVIAAMEFLGDLVADGAAVPPQESGLGSDATVLFRNGQLAFHATGAWDIAAFERTGIDFQLEVIPVPQSPDGLGTTLGGSSLFVPSSSQQRELAFAFMVHMTSDEYAQRYARESGRLPARHALFDDPLFDEPSFAPVRESLEVAEPMLLIAWPGATEALIDAIADVTLGGIPADEAMRTAQRRAEASLTG